MPSAIEELKSMDHALLEAIRKRVPDKIYDDAGGHYILDDADKVALAKMDVWTDEELEQNLYMMTPLEDAPDPAQEKKDLLKYLNMDHRVYTTMVGYATHIMNTRNKDRNSLKRISPMRRKWRVPKA